MESGIHDSEAREEQKVQYLSSCHPRPGSRQHQQSRSSLHQPASPGKSHWPLHFSAAATTTNTEQGNMSNFLGPAKNWNWQHEKLQ